MRTMDGIFCSVRNPGEQGSAQFPNGVEFGRTIYAIGSQVVSGFDDKVGFAYNLDVMIGYADGNDISVADSVIGEAGSNIILKTGGSVGARIPFGISGISIGATGICSSTLTRTISTATFLAR